MSKLDANLPFSSAFVCKTKYNIEPKNITSLCFCFCFPRSCFFRVTHQSLSQFVSGCVTGWHHFISMVYLNYEAECEGMLPSKLMPSCSRYSKNAIWKCILETFILDDELSGQNYLIKTYLIVTLINASDPVCYKFKRFIYLQNKCIFCISLIISVLIYQLLP
jgi:hypothetical protein